MKTLLAVLLLACIGCAPRQTIPLPPPVVKLPPITQPIQIVAESSAKTEAVAVKITTQVDQLKQTADGLDAKLKIIDQTLSEAKPSITELESAHVVAHNAYGQLSDMALQFAALQTSNQELSATVQATHEAVENLKAEGIKKDLEVATHETNEKELRDSNKRKDGAIEAKEEKIASQVKEMAKMETVYHTWLWIKWGTICYVAAWIVLQLLSVFGVALPPPFNIILRVFKIFKKT